MVRAIVDEPLQPGQMDQAVAVAGLGEQLFHLLALIAEACTPAFNAIERFPSIVETLVTSLTNADKFPLPYINAVGHLLLILTESSKPTLLFFRSNKHLLESLVHIANGSLFPTLRSWTDKSINVPMMCAGIAYNIKAVYASKDYKVQMGALLAAVQTIAVECCDLNLEHVVAAGLALDANGELGTVIHPTFLLRAE